MYLVPRSLFRYSSKDFYSYSTKVNRNIVTGRLPPNLSSHVWNRYLSVETHAKETNDDDRLLERFIDDVRKQGRVSICEMESLIEKLKTIGSVSPSKMESLIRHCGILLTEQSSEKRQELARKTFQYFEHAGVQFNINHYNTLLTVYANCVPDDILDVLRRSNIEPNQTTYRLLISSHCQTGNLDKAVRLFDLMNDEKIPPDVQIFNDLLRAYSNTKASNQIENLRGTMTKMSIKPNNETYLIMITHYIDQGFVLKAENLLTECEKEMKLRDEDYLAVVYTFEKFGYEHKAKELFSRIGEDRNFNDGMQNLVSRFVKDGKVESAFEMLDTMRKFHALDPSDFVSMLISGKVPITALSRLSENIKLEPQHTTALNAAMESALRSSDESKVLNLFKCAKALKLPVRQHYFWPLLVARGKTNPEGLYDLLRIMRDEFDVVPGRETLRDYVIPYILSTEADMNSLLLRLSNSGCPTSIGVGSLVINLLRRGDLEMASNIAQSYNTTYLPVSIVKTPLIESYLTTQDARSFVILLGAISDGMLMRERDTTDEAEIGEEVDPIGRLDFCGAMIRKLVRCLDREGRVYELETILKEMSNRSMGFNAKNGLVIRDVATQNGATAETIKLIDELTSSKFDTKYLPSRETCVSGTALHEQSLERLYESMKANGESTMAIKRQLFLTYGRNKKLDKLLKMKEELEADGFVFMSGMHSFVIDAYVEHGKCDEALSTYEQVRKNAPDFSLDVVKLLRFVSLLVKNDRVEKAFEVIKRKPADIGNRKNTNLLDLCSSLCQPILRRLVEKGDCEHVDAFFDAIVSGGLAPLRNVLAGPLVTVRLRRNDLDAALESFCKCCEKYSLTPWRNELARALITAGDRYQLQKLMDYSMKIHGTDSTLHDMLQLLIEEGRVKEARKILQNPNFTLSRDRIHKLGVQYGKEKAVEYLKNMLEAIEGVENVDRGEICYNLLTIYDERNEHGEALKLWKRMQDEHVAPTRDFRRLLHKILSRNELDVPEEIVHEKILPTDRPKTDDVTSRNDSLPELTRYLSANDLEGAVKFAEQCELSQQDLSLLMDKCLREKPYSVAKELFEKFFAPKNMVPVAETLKFLLRTAMRCGDVEFIERFANISEDERKALSYDNTLCRAYAHAGRGQEYVDRLERRLDEIKDDDLFKRYVEMFPKGGILTCLVANPATKEQIERVLEKCKRRDSKLLFPDNIMWSYFMSTKQFDKAKLIWDSSLASRKETVMFEKLVADVQKNQDIELGEHLLKMLSTKANLSPAAIGIAYSALISAFVQKNRIRDALNLLDVAVLKIPIEKMVVANLVTLKAACDAKHLLFRYTIPSSNRKSIHRLDPEGFELP